MTPHEELVQALTVERFAPRQARAAASAPAEDTAARRELLEQAVKHAPVHDGKVVHLHERRSA